MRRRPNGLGLGNSRTRCYGDAHPRPRTTEHLHKRVDAEQVQLTANNVAYSGLRHTKELCRLHLGQATRLDDSGQLDHEVSTDLEVLGLS
jgi:hypothetical protein